MAVLKSNMPKVFCTALDIRNKNRNIRALDRNSRILMSDAMLYMYSLEATGIIMGKLNQYYSGYGAFETDSPFFAPPQKKYADEDGAGENQGTGNLLGVTIASTAETELWTVTFSSATAFSVKGSRSGSQGSGTTGADFTSTNTDIVIPDEFWDGDDFVANDEFYIAAYNNYPIVVAIATLLGAGLANEALYNEAAPNQNTIGTRYYEKGIELLNAIADPNNMASLGSFDEGDTMDIQLYYEISPDGRDITGYSPDEYSRFSSGTIQQILQPWWW